MGSEPWVGPVSALVLFPGIRCFSPFIHSGFCESLGRVRCGGREGVLMCVSVNSVFCAESESESKAIKQVPPQ